MRIYLPLLILLLTVAPPPLLFAAAQTSSVRSADDANFNSVSSLIVALLVSSLVFTAFVSIYIRHCYHDITDGTNPRYIVRPRRLSETGLDPAVIDSFPIFDYSKIKHLKMGKGALSCAVCLLEFEDDETLRLLPKCDHVFHPECIDAWLASHFTCPICRADLSEKIESIQLTEESNSSSEVQNQNQISITVDENQRIDSETRVGVRMFPRPHSTGHSLFQLGEDCERYTLRLPDEVRSQVDRLDTVGRSDQWVCTMTPPFFSINGSVMSAKATIVDGKVTPVGTSTGFLTPVKSPLDYQSGKSEQMSPRLPV